MERHYAVQVGDDVEFVKLNKVLVDFLTKLNVDRRKDSSVDKTFVKGLIIAAFTVQKVKTNDILNQDLMEFIHDLFLSRVENDENRISSFVRLTNAACHEIRRMKK